MKKISIKSSIKNYNVHFDKSKIILNNFNDTFFIIDEKVYKLFFKNKKYKYNSNIILIKAKEKNKSIINSINILRKFEKLKVKRNSKIIVIGGGIIQDVSSFCCSIYQRGISWTFYPTTLLAQADSCIGSKTSINFYNTKNLLGNYYPPNSVKINFNFLNTLNKSEIHSGIGEIYKVHLIDNFNSFIKNKKFFLNIEKKNNLEKAIFKSLKIKKSIIEKDEFDKNIRKIMNYGHTFGHAIESATDFKIPHGIAVTIGLDLANYVSLKHKYISKKQYFEISEILKKNFKNYTKIKIDIKKFFKAIYKDKKMINKNKIYLIIPFKNKIIKKKFNINNKLKQLIKNYISNI